jgi:tRNA U34 5-methylaminomethyl-2-thiouridine-forming methyltransferase MnmC
MIKQFNARYRVTVYTQQETIVVEYPLTCKFNVTRGVFADSNKATIQLYNLAPATRNLIFQDAYTDGLDPTKWKYVHLEAGYGDAPMPLIFTGRIIQRTI